MRVALAHAASTEQNGQQTVNHIITLLSCALISGSAFAAQPLGRFFFTPSERTELDMARSQKNIREVPARIDPPAVAEPSASTLTYSGLVRRSDGRALLWINNRVVDERDALTGLNLRGHVRADGAVAVEIPATGRAAEIKVGQSFDVRAGGIVEGMAVRDSRQEAEATPQLRRGSDQEKDAERASGPSQP